MKIKTVSNVQKFATNIMTETQVNETLERLIAEIGYSDLLDGIIYSLDVRTRTNILNQIKKAYNVEI